MSNITVGQIIMDAQRMASRVKDLDALSSALIVEAEGNNRLVESLRQFQSDMDSLNRISNNKSNSEMVNRIQQQNANSSEILKENRELKICVEDCERAMELIMQKYREHTSAKVLDSKFNFKELYNERLWQIIREQREKINEMAAVMQRAASADEDAGNAELEVMARLRLENKTLRELLQISKQFGSTQYPIRFNEHLLEEKGVQTDEVAEDEDAVVAGFATDECSTDELSLSGASIENVNNNSVIQLNISDSATAVAVAVAAAAPATDNAHSPAPASLAAGENNNGPVEPVVGAPPLPASKTEEMTDNLPPAQPSATSVTTTATAAAGAAGSCLEANATKVAASAT